MPGTASRRSRGSKPERNDLFAVSAEACIQFFFFILKAFQPEKKKEKKERRGDWRKGLSENAGGWGWGSRGKAELFLESYEVLRERPGDCKAQGGTRWMKWWFLSPREETELYEELRENLGRWESEDYRECSPCMLERDLERGSTWSSFGMEYESFPALPYAFFGCIFCPGLYVSWKNYD